MILLIADTPVAGTVQRFSRWLELLTTEPVVCLIKRNYVGNPFSLRETIPIGSYSKWRDIIISQVKKARRIIVHNINDKETLALIFSNCTDPQKIAYHYHSPPLEAPCEAYDILNYFEFPVIFTTAQGHSRFVNGAITVPNIVSDYEIPFTVDRDKVIFLPHLRSTSFRWSAKLTEADIEALNERKHSLRGFKIKDIKSVFNRDVVSHDEILFYLKCIDIIIDDINTGLFHQVSIEGLKAGAIVFNGADYYSVSDFSDAIEAPPPPFLFVNDVHDLIDTISSSVFQKNIRLLQSRSLVYATEFLTERRLATLAVKKLEIFLK